ncbi:MAG TPA: hypothetical protein DHU96_08880 [Actinobacteria bacterium]|nr:hypothetical protein [Actinomycetota bacterium]
MPSEPLLRCAERVIELISAWFPKDENVDVSGALPGLSFVPGCAAAEPRQRRYLAGTHPDKVQSAA